MQVYTTLAQGTDMTDMCCALTSGIVSFNNLPQTIQHLNHDTYVTPILYMNLPPKKILSCHKNTQEKIVMVSRKTFSFAVTL
jgi:hypothetical protein